MYSKCFVLRRKSSVQCEFLGKIATFHMGKDHHFEHWLQVPRSIMLEINVWFFCFVLKGVAPRPQIFHLPFFLIMCFSPFLPRLTQLIIRGSLSPDAPQNQFVNLTFLDGMHDFESINSEP